MYLMPTLEDAILKLKVFIECKDIAEIIENLSTTLVSKEIDYKLIGSIRKKLNQILLDKQHDVTCKNGLLLKDVAYEALLSVAKGFPNNENDPISLEKINDQDQVVISTGDQFDIRSLVNYYNKNPIKAFYNPLTNLPLSERDSQHIKFIAAQTGNPIHTNTSVSLHFSIEEIQEIGYQIATGYSEAYQSIRVDHSFFRHNNGTNPVYINRGDMNFHLRSATESSISNGFFGGICRASISAAKVGMLGSLSTQFLHPVVIGLFGTLTHDEQLSYALTAACQSKLYYSSYFLLSMYEHAEVVGNFLGYTFLAGLAVEFFCSSRFGDILRRTSADPVKYRLILTSCILTLAALVTALTAVRIDPSITAKATFNYSFYIRLITAAAVSMAHSTIVGGVLGGSFYCLEKTLENIEGRNDNFHIPII